MVRKTKFIICFWLHDDNISYLFYFFSMIGKRNISKVLSAFDSDDESSDDGKTIYKIISRF